MHLFVLLLVLVLPFFEGCESALGLFLVHTTALAVLLISVLKSGRLWIPPLRLFLPFLLYLILSCAIAPYRFSAFLQLWDWWYAAILAVTLFHVLKEHPPEELDNLLFLSFVVGSGALIASAAIYWAPHIQRWSGSFVNPNDFGTYAVLLLLMGIFQLERTASPARMRVVWIVLALLTLCIALAFSRAVFLACLAGTVFHLWERRPSRWIVVTMIAFLSFISIVLALRLANLHDPFQYYRLKIWKYSLLGILSDPYLGIGLNMLPWKAAQFNFPADMEVGRFARIATSADNQYLQILAETGFVGLFLFLIGWTALFFLLRRLPKRFHILRYPPFIVMSIIALFSLPLNNTAIVSIFLFLLAIPVAASNEIRVAHLELGKPARAFLVMIAILLFTGCVYLPFRADYEFRAATRSSTTQEASEHIRRAIRLNPYQPYYRFHVVKALVDSAPQLETGEWLKAVETLKKCARLNPLDSNFYIYQGKIFRILYSRTRDERYYAETVSAYLTAQEHSPYHVFQRAEFAYFLVASGRHGEAREELSRILELEPAFLNARLLLIEILLEEGSKDEARVLMADFEERTKRYYPIASATEPYVRKLLQYDSEKKARLQALINADDSN